MSSSKAQPHNDSSNNEVGFRSKLKENELRRLILIDGFNIMHHFKNMCFENSIYNEKMCPLILIPLVYNLIKEGFVVRVVLKNLPPEKRITDSYVLTQLEKTGLCIYGLHSRVEEEDDLVMLELAKRYGAFIISRDQFRNHRKYEDIALHNVVAYDKVATGFFKDAASIEDLYYELFFKYAIELHESPDRFIVDPSSDDYELVQKSQEKFKQINEGNFENLKILYLFTHAYSCYVYHLKIPPVVADFIEEDDFPMTYAQFETAFDRRMEYRRKHRIFEADVYAFEKEEDDIFSESDLDCITYGNGDAA